MNTHSNDTTNPTGDAEDFERKHEDLHNQMDEADYGVICAGCDVSDATAAYNRTVRHRVGLERELARYRRDVDVTNMTPAIKSIIDQHEQRIAAAKDSTDDAQCELNKAKRKLRHAQKVAADLEREHAKHLASVIGGADLDGIIKELFKSTSSGGDSYSRIPWSLFGANPGDSFSSFVTGLIIDGDNPQSKGAQHSGSGKRRLFDDLGINYDDLIRSNSFGKRENFGNAGGRIRNTRSDEPTRQGPSPFEG